MGVRLLGVLKQNQLVSRHGPNRRSSRSTSRRTTPARGAASSRAVPGPLARRHRFQDKPTAGTRSNAGATRPRLVCDQLPTVERIRVGEARQRVASGQALLICAYDDEERYRKFNLEGAIWLVDLQTRLTSLSKDHELIFYCA